MHRPAPAVVVVAAVVLIGLVAYMVVATTEPEEPDLAELGVERSSELIIDDCFDFPDGAEPADRPEVDLVDSQRCADPHDVELYAEVRTYQGEIMERRDEYPGTAKILADNLSECVARYEKFVGAPYRDSAYEVIVIVPTGDMWLEPTDRVSLCGVMSPDGEKLEGTVKG